MTNNLKATACAGGQLVNLVRYPIDDLDSEVGKRLLAACSAQLANTGACNLTNFLTSEASARLAAEAEEFAPLAYQKDITRNAYFTADDPLLPPDHPRRTFWPLRMSQIANDVIPTDALIRGLYDWDPLLDFVRRAQGLDRLFRMGDPYQALNLTFLQDGDHQPWHFDDSDFVITLLLQASTSGGEFEFVPHIRSANDENYTAVRQVFAGDLRNVIRLPRSAGTLTLFQGMCSVHRVTQVVGARKRITAVFGYDNVPDRIAPLESNIITYGPRVARALAKPRISARS
jgi:hypothetical protein